MCWWWAWACAVICGPGVGLLGTRIGAGVGLVVSALRNAGKLMGWTITDRTSSSGSSSPVNRKWKQMYHNRCSLKPKQLLLMGFCCGLLIIGQIMYSLKNYTKIQGLHCLTAHTLVILFQSKKLFWSIQRNQICERRNNLLFAVSKI